MDNKSWMVFFLESMTFGVLVNTSIPSSAGYTQEVTSFPFFNSTIHTRQAPISLISFKKHKVGISICASLAASRMVEPLGAVTSMPLIFSLIVSFVYSLPFIFCTLCARTCPAGAIIGSVKNPHIIDQNKCIKCGACMEKCKFGAIYKK